jgi:hypothetical protein
MHLFQAVNKCFPTNNRSTDIGCFTVCCTVHKSTPQYTVSKMTIQNKGKVSIISVYKLTIIFSPDGLTYVFNNSNNKCKVQIRCLFKQDYEYRLIVLLWCIGTYFSWFKVTCCHCALQLYTVRKEHVYKCINHT